MSEYFNLNDDLQRAKKAQKKYFPQLSRRLIIPAIVTLSIPLTVVLALTQTNILKFAGGGPEIAEVRVNPGSINSAVNGPESHLSALAVDSNGIPVEYPVTYEWSMSSTNTVGTLSRTETNLTDFKPLSVGCGQLTVTARNGDNVVTKTVSVAVSDTSTTPNCGPTPTSTPVSSEFGSALHVTDNSGYARLSNSGDIGPFTDGLTIEALVYYIPNQNNIYYPIVSKGFQLSQKETMPFNFNITKDGHLSFIYTVQYGGRWAHTEIRSNSTIDTLGFHHVAVVYNNIEGSVDYGKIFLMIDGKVDKVQQQFGPIGGGSRGDVTVGFAADTKFSGVIDEVRITAMINYFIGQQYVQTEPFMNDIATYALVKFDNNLDEVAGEHNGVAEDGQIEYVESVDSPFIYPDVSTPVPTETPSPTPTFTVTPTFTPVPTPSNKVITLYPTADAFVRATSPNTNFGKVASLETDNNPNEISYMRFNLSALAGKTIVKASLKLKVSDPTPVAQTLRRMSTANWSETGITYNSRPANEGIITNFNGRPVNSVTDLNVRNIVNLRKGGNMTLAVTSEGTDSAAYYSRESAAANRPQLIIEYK